jgi:hypothetical protein
MLRSYEKADQRRHREERSDVAIHATGASLAPMDYSLRSPCGPAFGCSTRYAR